MKKKKSSVDNNTPQAENTVEKLLSEYIKELAQENPTLDNHDELVDELRDKAFEKAGFSDWNDENEKNKEELSILTEQAVKMWKQELIQEAQPWPEWEALVKIVETTPFIIQSLNDNNVSNARTIRLSSYPADIYDRNEFAITKSTKRFQNNTAINTNVFASRPDIFPSYLKPLLGLGYGYFDCEEQTGIGAYLFKYPDLVEVTPELCKDVFSPVYLTNISTDKALIFPKRKIFLFQSLDPGCFVIDEDQNIRLFSPQSNSFEVFGKLENFVRYHLRHIIERWPSLYDSIIEEKCFDEYNLTYITPY